MKFLGLMVISSLGLLLTSCKKDTTTVANSNIKINEQFSVSAYQKGGDLIKTADGGYLLFGSTSTDGKYYDLYLIKTDKEGKEQWHAVHGETSTGSGTDIAYIDEQAVRAIELSSGEYALACNRTYYKESNLSGTFTPEKTKIVLYKIGGTGANLSSIELNTADEYSYQVTDIQLLDDGGFVLVGNTSNVNKNKPQYDMYKEYDKQDMLITRLNSDFSNVWASSSSLSQGKGFVGIDAASGVTVTKDGYFLMIGTAQEFTELNQAYENNLIAILFNPTEGGILNQKTYGVGYGLITKDMYFDEEKGEAAVLAYEPIPNSEYGNLVLIKVSTSGFGLDFPVPAELYGSNGQALQNEDGGTLTAPLMANRIIKGLGEHQHAIGATTHNGADSQWLWFGLDNNGDVVAESENYVGTKNETGVPTLDELSSIVINQEADGYAITGTFDGVGGTSIGLVIAVK